MGCFWRLLLLPPAAPTLIATLKKAICSYVDTFDANFATHKQLQTLQQLQDFLNFDSCPSIEFTLSAYGYESSKSGITRARDHSADARRQRILQLPNYESSLSVHVAAYAAYHHEECSITVIGMRITTQCVELLNDFL